MKRRDLLRYTAYLAGATLSAPVSSALLSGCKRDAEVAAGEKAYQTVLFNDDEFNFITRFADTMLPTTDTPGAIDVGAHEMVDKMVGEVYSEEDRETFRTGLSRLMEELENPEQEGGAFGGRKGEDALVYLQDQDLHYRSDDAEFATTGAEGPTARDAYFDLKGMIIGAWYNSQPIATEVLAYLPVPGEYIPCGNLQELTGGRAWAI